MLSFEFNFPVTVNPPAKVEQTLTSTIINRITGEMKTFD